VHELSVEPVVVALPEDHPQAARAEVALADLADETFVAWQAPYDEHFDDFIAGACARAGFVPNMQFHGPQVHTVLHMVAAGFGVGMIPRRDSVLRAPGTVVRPLAPPGATVASRSPTTGTGRSPPCGRSSTGCSSTPRTTPDRDDMRLEPEHLGIAVILPTWPFACHGGLHHATRRWRQ
jgi:hypothetical protein